MIRKGCAMEGTRIGISGRRLRMAASIWEHLSVIPDPRVDRTKLHKLEFWGRHTDFDGFLDAGRQQKSLGDMGWSLRSS